MLPAWSKPRAEETVVAHLDKALGEHMLQKTADEFLGSLRAIIGFAGSSGLATQGHLAIHQLHNALVANGYPENVSSQLLQCS